MRRRRNWFWPLGLAALIVLSGISLLLIRPNPVRLVIETGSSMAIALFSMLMWLSSDDVRYMNSIQTRHFMRKERNLERQTHSKRALQLFKVTAGLAEIQWFLRSLANHELAWQYVSSHPRLAYLEIIGEWIDRFGTEDEEVIAGLIQFRSRLLFFYLSQNNLQEPSGKQELQQIYELADELKKTFTNRRQDILAEINK